MAQLEFYDGNAYQTVGNPGTITSITAGTGLTGGTITSSGTIALANTTITAGSFAYPSSVTFNAQGQATAAVAGTAPVTLISGTANQITITGTTTPTVSFANSMVTPGDLTVSGTGFIRIPVGTTAQRPATPVAGMMRINTSL
jgi:hypothetical protein